MVFNGKLESFKSIISIDFLLAQHLKVFVGLCNYLALRWSTNQQIFGYKDAYVSYSIFNILMKRHFGRRLETYPFGK